MSDYSLYILTLYFFTLCAVFFVRFVDIKIGSFLAVVTAFSTFGVAASRPSHFPDVDSYETIYKLSASGDFSSAGYWISHGEPGFKILSYAVSLAGTPYTGFLLIISAISGLLLFYISRIAALPFAYVWFTYFSFHFITRDLGVIRLGIASHLIVIFFLQRTIISQAVTLIIASLTFQYFAFVSVLAKLFSRFKVNWGSLSFLFVVSSLSAFFINFENIVFLIPEKQSITYEGSESGGTSIFLPLFRNVFLAFFLYFFMRNELRFRYFRAYIWAAFFSAMIYIMASEILIVAQRFSAYFGAVVPLAMAYLMHRRENGAYLFFLVILVALVNFLSLFYFNDFVWRVE